MVFAVKKSAFLSEILRGEKSEKNRNLTGCQIFERVAGEWGDKSVPLILDQNKGVIECDSNPNTYKKK